MNEQNEIRGDEWDDVRTWEDDAAEGDALAEQQGEEALDARYEGLDAYEDSECPVYYLEDHDLEAWYKEWLEGELAD